MTVPTDYSQINKVAAEIARLRSALEHIIETWHCGDIKPEDIALCRAALGRPPHSAPRTCSTCHAVLADGPQPAATYEAQDSRNADAILRQIDAASFMDGTIYDAIIAAKRYVSSTLPSQQGNCK